MKRFLSFLLLVCFLYSFCGCMHGTASPSGTAPSFSETAAYIETTAETVPETTTPELDDPYLHFPAAWTVNCKEYITFATAPGATSSVRLTSGTSLELLGWQEKHAKVSYNGKTGFVLANYIQPADTGAIGSMLSVVSPTATYSYTQMRDDISTLVESYPQSCTTEIIGYSEESRPIPVLRIGKEDAKYHILVQGAIHGREHMTAWLVMAMADFWLRNHITFRTPDVCYHLIPMSNPDGVTISQSSMLGVNQQPIYFREVEENRLKDTVEEYAQRWKANAMGIDLNRNFPANWENITGIPAPASQGYPGQTPYCAAEAAALRDYTLRYTFNSTLSYHAYGSIIYYEFGVKQPVNDQSRDLAATVQEITGYRPHVTDPSESTAVEGGGYKDWVMEELEIPSLTIEIGCSPAPLKENELSNVFFRNLPVLPAVAQWVTQQ